MSEQGQWLRRYRRSLMVTGISVVLFGWCVASAAPSDNARWVKNLHSGHQSETFRKAVAGLNAAGQVRLDECTACHSPQNWVSNLILPKPPVQDAACRKCHEPAPPESESGEAEEKGTKLGMSWLGKRLRRPAHEGIDFPGRAGGMGLAAGQSLACADCHPDHEGTDLKDARLADFQHPVSRGKGQPAAARVTIEDTQRFRMTGVCVGCHLPTEPGAEATEVLREFLRSHNTGDGFDPPVPDAAAALLSQAPKNTPLDPGSQKKVVEAVLGTVRQQVLFGDVDEALRGCTPGCHGEHTPMTNDAEKYELPKSASR